MTGRVKYAGIPAPALDQAPPIGPAAAVVEALRRAGAARPSLPPEQLPLLEVAAGEPEAAAAPAAGERPRGGRPPGARNRRTEDWVEYLLSRYRSPLIVLAETYSRPADVLAAELGISRAEAFAMQLTAARELAPYVHARHAPAAPAPTTAAVELILTGVEPPADAAGEGAEPETIEVVDVAPERQADQ